MKYATRMSAGSLLLFAVVVPAVGASEEQDGAVTAWFAEHAPAEVSAVGAQWWTDLLARGERNLAFGDPVPLVGIRPPEFDLQRDVIMGDVSLEANLDRSASELRAAGEESPEASSNES